MNSMLVVLVPLSHQLQSAPAAHHISLQVGIIIRGLSCTGTMRILWISFLLIGSITCVPPNLGSGDEQQQTLWRYIASSKPVNMYPSGQADGFGGSSSPGFYYSSGPSSFGGAVRGSTYWAQQRDYQDGQPGAPGGSGFQVAEDRWNPSFHPGEDEPDFTSVKDKDVVHTKDSRSRYNRFQYSNTRFDYTPTGSGTFHTSMFPFPGGKTLPGQDYVKNVY